MDLITNISSVCPIPFDRLRANGRLNQPFLLKGEWLGVKATPQ
jgi:hypothetical protein